MPTLDRRQALTAIVAASAAAGLAACSRSSSTQASKPDPQLKDLADEQSLLAAYDATLTRHPDLSGQLVPLRQEHAEHHAALAAMLGQPTSKTATPSANTSAAAAASSSTATVPSDKAAAIAALRKAENAAAAARTASCLTASKERAALLASIAACEASHEVVLT